MELASLHRKVDSSKTSKGRKPKDKAVKGKDDDRIALHARKFCVMNEVFVPEAAFLTKDPNFDPLDSERYKTPDSIRNGIIAELFEEVLEDLHKLLQESGSFRDLVSAMLLYFFFLWLNRHYNTTSLWLLWIRVAARLSIRYETKLLWRYFRNLRNTRILRWKIAGPILSSSLPWCLLERIRSPNSHQFFLKAVSGTWESFSNANILRWWEFSHSFISCHQHPLDASVNSLRTQFSE